MTSEPKNPKNRYILFLGERRYEFVAKASGNYRNGISLAAKAFAELPESNKYIEKAKERKDACDRDLQAFVQAGGETAKAAKARRIKEHENLFHQKTHEDLFLVLG